MQELELMDVIKKAMQKQNLRENISLFSEIKKYECNICKDKEYVWVKEAEAMKPCVCRAQKSIKRRLKKAGISIKEYEKKNINNFPTDRKEAVEMKELAVDFIKNHQKGESIVFVGKSGTLKTTICMAICLELTRLGENHKYFSYRDEIPRLRNMMFKNAEGYENEIKKLTTCDNLFIDDLFKSMKSATATKDNNFKIEISPTDLHIMFQIINRRYINKKTTLFSTEYTISQIINEVDEATGTRIFEMCKKYWKVCNDINRRLV